MKHIKGMYDELDGVVRFMKMDDRKAYQEAVKKKARFDTLKKERAETVEFFNRISGDPEIKKLALRRQLRDNTAAFETEFGIKEKA